MNHEFFVDTKRTVKNVPGTPVVLVLVLEAGKNAKQRKNGIKNKKKERHKKQRKQRTSGGFPTK